MFTNKSGWTIRIGLFLLALAWFSFTFYEFTNGILHNTHPARDAPVWTWLLFSDTGCGIGLAFRTVGGLIAVITAMFYLVKRDLSESEALMSLRYIVIFEAAYWLSFLFSIIPNAWSPLTTMTIENNIPVTVESIALPIVLIILFFNLTPKKASTGGIKWGLISGTVYIFIFWLNNACNWIAAVFWVKGVDYLTLYPANLFSFLLTTVGLLLLALFSAYFSIKSIRKRDFTKLNLRTVGIIITTFGLYFDIIFVMYLFLGAVGGWGLWYQWFTGHNLDLWLLALPMAGLPFLFQRKAQNLPAKNESPT
jgi:hypothetical protein